MTIMTLSEAAKLDKRKHPRMYAEHGFELDPVIYRTRQWSVTEFGLENHVGPWRYYIPWADIRPTPEGQHGWEEHMAEKNWVDTDSFGDAFRYALRLKERGYQPPEKSHE
jgi:hypothetical protein